MEGGQTALTSSSTSLQIALLVAFNYDERLTLEACLGWPKECEE